MRAQAEASYKMERDVTIIILSQLANLLPLSLAYNKDKLRIYMIAYLSLRLL